MKELSIEEKAKAYDEAIERSKNYYSTTDSASDIKLIGLIFPELKESEDEKIRKALSAYFAKFKPNDMWDADFSFGDIVAWLEKQGNLMKALQISNAEIGELIEKNYYLKEQLEKQSEQKPTDKIKPKFKVGDIVKHKDNPHLTYILKRFTDDGDYEFRAIGKDGNEGCACFAGVKYQDDWELVKQKPAWSEKYIADVFEKVGLAKIAREQSNDNLTNALQDAMIELSKFIPQPKQEWSEEDEDIRNELIKHFTSLLECIATEERHMENRRWLNWLKSLRPQNRWKPSDEQIQALEAIIGCVHDNASWEIGTEWFGVLFKLKEQLKKLREG